MICNCTSADEHFSSGCSRRVIEDAVNRRHTLPQDTYVRYVRTCDCISAEEHFSRKCGTSYETND